MEIEKFKKKKSYKDQSRFPEFPDLEIGTPIYSPILRYVGLISEGLLSANPGPVENSSWNRGLW